jgi:uncharacterized protein YqeY
MTPLEAQIDAGFKEALRSRDTERLTILRLLRAALKNREVERRGPLTEAEVVSIIRGLIRQGQDSVTQYEKGGRNDLAEKERKEIAVLNALLPAAPSAGEIRSLVDQIIAEVQATGPRDLGRVMKPVMSRLAGRADGQVVQTIVKEKLAAV